MATQTGRGPAPPAGVELPVTRDAPSESGATVGASSPAMAAAVDAHLAPVGASVVPSPRRALELVGLVIAPTTLVTALAFFFGWVLTNSRASYFGIDASVLGYSTQDYLLRSADALFVPLASVLVLALGSVWLHGLAIRQLREPDGRARLAIVARAAVVVGSALFVLGAVAVFRPLPFSPHRYWFPSAIPGIGIALLAYGLHLRDSCATVERGTRGAPSDGARSMRATALTLVALLIVLSGFWTASRYADALGRGRAVRLAASLTLRPQVTVYAPQRLALDSRGVTEQRLKGAPGAYRYRYSGLRLLVRSGGKYFLLPNGWTRRAGTAIVLDDSSAYRFEFGAGR